MQVSITEYNFSKVFQTEKFILKFVGFYPCQRLKLFSWASLRRFLSLSIILMQFISMMSYVYLEDLGKLIDPSLIYATHLAFCFKIALFYRNGKLLRHIEATLEDPIFYKFSMDLLKQVKKPINTTRIIALTYRILIKLYLTILTVTLLINVKSKPLPFAGWLPYDVNESIYYYPTLILEIVCLAISGYSHTSMDIISYYLLAVTGCQFDVLINNLKNIDYSADVAVVINELKRNVKYHLEIIKLFENINEMYSRIVFIQCITSAFIICLAGFQAIVGSTSPFQFCLMLVYLCGLFVQVGFYCWFGHNIVVKSTDVGEACYLTNWYESDIEIRKMLFIIMERSKRPVEFTSGGFFTLSLPFLTTILKSSYSYFALLQHMYSK